MGSKLSEPASTSHFKARRRADYRYFLSYRTRWSDNDQYSHINNAVYYHLFDSVINAYLIAHCDLSPQTSGSIGLVVSSQCQFFSPLSFPDVLDLGLRVNRLGKSSVTYEVGIFREGSTEPAAVGGYTHVFVDAVSRKTSQMGERMREGLQKVFVEPKSSKPESKL
ncbi:thioesterase [Lactifluus subvellereus]|nr:thioesterase [Lactifluus subvellereus]